MIRQNIQNFKLGSLHRTKATASSGLALLMTFAKDIGLGKQLDLRFSHLKLRQRGYSVDQRLHPHARLFHGRPGHPQDPLGEMGPLSPAAASPLAGLGMAAVIIAQALLL